MSGVLIRAGARALGLRATPVASFSARSSLSRQEVRSLVATQQRFFSDIVDSEANAEKEKLKTKLEDGQQMHVIDKDGVSSKDNLSGDWKPSEETVDGDKSEIAPTQPEIEIKDEPAIVEDEVRSGKTTKHAFQAETVQLLRIVANSLYTDKEVFIRELVSNASDALEKLRYTKLVNNEELPDLQISLATDKEKNLLIFQDNGIGMNHEELVSHLGTIARSGSKAFLNKLQESDKDSASSIIGQFGVGFYSSFMVADEVRVYSKSAQEDSQGYVWISDGSGEYTLEPCEGVAVGTKIVLQLKSDQKLYSNNDFVLDIIKKYSNFVQFPIFLNKKKVNTIDALWFHDAKDISPQQHTEFYRFVSNAFDTPMYNLLYSTDAPVSVRALLYVPEAQSEKFGMQKAESAVHLYSRRVLIKHKADGLLPDYLRFVKGVIDSEDIPLNISRENMQDSALIRRLKNILTKRVLRWFSDMAKQDPEKYNYKFFHEFGMNLKEGICTDVTAKDDLAKLLRFESSATPEGQVTSFEDYTSRMGSEQKNIFYLLCPNRAAAEMSPYYESFKAAGTEVIFMYAEVDEFVMGNLQTFAGKKLVAAESAEAEAPVTPEGNASSLSEEQTQSFAEWMKEVLATKVTEVKKTNRLADSPAIVVDYESPAWRKMMLMANRTDNTTLPKQKLRINPNHSIIVGLNAIRNSSPDLARDIANQVFDNALIAAGLMDNPRSMLSRMNSLISNVLTHERGGVREVEADYSERLEGGPKAMDADTIEAKVDEDTPLEGTTIDAEAKK